MDFPYNGSLKVQENMVVYTLQPSHSLSPLQALFGVVEEHAPSQEDKGLRREQICMESLHINFAGRQKQVKYKQLGL